MPDSLIKIGSLCKESGVSIKTIRYYEQLGLIHAAERTSGGFRLFTPDALSRLVFIKRGQKLGLSLQEIGRILSIRDRGEMPCHAVEQILKKKVAEIEERIHELRQLQAEMQELLVESRWPPTSDTVICPIIQPHYCESVGMDLAGMEMASTTRFSEPNRIGLL